MTHTPRPWKQAGTLIYSPDHGVICELSELTPASGYIEHCRLQLGSTNWDEAMANGDLIVTAPELLAELGNLVNEARGILALLEEQPRVVGWTNIKCLSRRILAAQAIIVKAKGQEQ